VAKTFDTLGKPAEMSIGGGGGGHLPDFTSSRCLKAKRHESDREGGSDTFWEQKSEKQKESFKVRPGLEKRIKIMNRVQQGKNSEKTGPR